MRRVGLFKRLNEAWLWGYRGREYDTLRAVLKRETKKEVEQELSEIRREQERRNRSWDPEDWDDFLYGGL